MSRPRVLLAEDNPVMAAELRALLEPELEVVATVADGAALVTAADMARPDVIVTDIVMPHRSGIDATVEVLRRHPETRIVLVTVHDDPGPRRARAGRRRPGPRPEGRRGHRPLAGRPRGVAQRAVRLIAAPRASFTNGSAAQVRPVTVCVAQSGRTGDTVAGRRSTRDGGNVSWDPSRLVRARGVTRRSRAS